jgi:hypothetical protein
MVRLKIYPVHHRRHIWEIRKFGAQILSPKGYASCADGFFKGTSLICIVSHGNRNTFGQIFSSLTRFHLPQSRYVPWLTK